MHQLMNNYNMLIVFFLFHPVYLLLKFLIISKVMTYDYSHNMLENKLISLKKNVIVNSRYRDSEIK